METKKIFYLAAFVVLVLPGLLRAQVPRFEWVRHLGGMDEVIARAVAVNQLDQIYVSGQFRGTVQIGATTLTSLGNYDIFLAKFDPDGTVLWARRFGGPDFDEAHGLAVDNNGDLAMAGRFIGPSTFGSVTLPGFGGTDIFVAKFDGDGNLLWAKQVGASSNEGGWKVATDSVNNVIVVGWIHVNPTNFDGTVISSKGSWDPFVAKYNADGNLLWVKSGGGAALDNAFEVAITPDDRIVIAGSFRSPDFTLDGFTFSSRGDLDIFLAWYQVDGTLLKAVQAGGSGTDAPAGLTVDPAGNAYLAGSFMNTAIFDGTALTTSARYDGFLAKYSASGSLLWVRQLNALRVGGGGGVILGSTGHVYMSGAFANEMFLDGVTLTAPSDSFDVFVAKFDPAGSLVWAMRGGDMYNDVSFDIALDSDDNLYLPGFFQNKTTLGDFSFTSVDTFDAFLAKISQFSVLARAECAAELPQGCPLSIPITIDVSGTSPSEKLGSFTGTLTWDPAVLRFTGHSGLLAGFTGAVNEAGVGSGELQFNGANTAGTEGKTDVLRVDFEVTGAVGSTGMIDLSFSAMAAAGSFRDLLPDLTVQGCDFTITEGGLLGDVNGDGLVNSTDALIVLSHDVGFEVPDDIRARIDSGIGDTNADGLTNSTDALIILSFDVGFEVPFPLGKRFCP